MEKLGEKITFTWDTKISITAQLSHIAIPIYIYSMVSHFLIQGGTWFH